MNCSWRSWEDNGMAIRYRLGSVFWTITLLAVALGWFCDRRQLDARHALEIQQLEARHGREIQEQWRARRRDSVLLENGLERQHQLTELLRAVSGTATQD
jgi:hypothetical protein